MYEREREREIMSPFKTDRFAGTKFIRNSILVEDNPQAIVGSHCWLKLVV